MKKYKMDDILKNAKSEWNNSQQTPDMWKSIHQEINSGKVGAGQKILGFVLEYKMTFATGFALLVILVAITITQNPSKLITAYEAEKLANEIDRDVYKAQKIYENVIAEMEKNCPISELTTENNLAQAYFDKIRLLDQVIFLCKSSLEENPYNPTIHKQLFFAYNEKINVYKELQTLSEKELS